MCRIELEWVVRFRDSQATHKQHLSSSCFSVLFIFGWNFPDIFGGKLRINKWNMLTNFHVKIKSENRFGKQQEGTFYSVMQLEAKCADIQSYFFFCLFL